MRRLRHPSSCDKRGMYEYLRPTIAKEFRLLRKTMLKVYEKTRRADDLYWYAFGYISALRDVRFEEKPCKQQ